MKLQSKNNYKLPDTVTWQGSNKCTLQFLIITVEAKECMFYFHPAEGHKSKRIFNILRAIIRIASLYTSSGTDLKIQTAYVLRCFTYFYS